MKVAYLVNHYPHTSHSFIRREILALEAAGVEVDRYSVRPVGVDLVDPADQEEARRTRVILAAGAASLLLAAARRALGHPLVFLRAMRLALSVGWRSDRGVLRHLIYLVEACLLADWLACSGIGHLHAHFGTNSATVAMLASLLGGVPYSFTVHGPDEFDHPRELGIPKKIEHAAFVVAISEFARSQLYRWCAPGHWEKIHIVRCGVDAAFLSHPRTPVPPAPRFVCVGRLSEQKGHFVLVQAAARLRDQGVPLEVVLIGDGPLRGPIERMIRQHNLADVVRLAGWMSGAAVREALLNCRAMVLPSFAEGLPVVIMEALALGRPVISTCIAAIPELLAHGECGWVAAPGSVDALAAAIRQAVDSSTTRLEEMGRAGAHRVASQHDVNREAARLAELFARYGTDRPPLAEPKGADCRESDEVPHVLGR